jgi:septum formation protein
MEIILGSQSPRREEILSFFSIPFTKASSDFDEESIAFLGDPASYVKTIAQKKGEALSPSYPKKPILTADTTVFCEGKIYNKPRDRKEAFSFLSELQGKWHSVFTGMALIFEGSFFTEVEETRILFSPLSSEEINKYLDHVNFLDKAGSYAIQQGGSILVNRIEGCYYNVMGLPLNGLKTLLKKIDIDLWDHLKLL